LVEKLLTGIAAGLKQSFRAVLIASDISIELTSRRNRRCEVRTEYGSKVWPEAADTALEVGDSRLPALSVLPVVRALVGMPALQSTGSNHDADFLRLASSERPAKGLPSAAGLSSLADRFSAR
jgi:hypothetical protein